MPVSVRKPKAIVFDILGTASKSGFLEQILFPYLKQNLDQYISTHWNKKDFTGLYSKIVEQSLEQNRQDPNSPVVESHESANARQSLSAFINYVTENGVNSSAVTKLRFKVWFEGYNQMKLRTPIYKDVPERMRVWFADGIKFYVFSNTWVEAQKALLRNTNHGDLTNLIFGHFDNDFGLLTEVDSWQRLCNEIKVSPNDILFLTKAPNEGRAASDAGINVVLVLTHRHNVKAVAPDDRKRFPYVRTLDDLTWLEGSTMPTSVAAASGTSAAGGGGSTMPSGTGSTSAANGSTTASEMMRQNLARTAASSQLPSQQLTSAKPSSRASSSNVSSRHSSPNSSAVSSTAASSKPSSHRSTSKNNSSTATMTNSQAQSKSSAVSKK